MSTLVFASQLFGAIERSRTLDQLLQEPVDSLRDRWGCGYVVVLSGAKGSWKKVLSSGRAAAVGIAFVGFGHRPPGQPPGHPG